MNSYIFNVLTSALPYILIGLVLYNIGVLVPDRSAATALDPEGHQEASTSIFQRKKTFRTAGILIIVAGIIYSVVSPTNTPKNRLNVDRAAENAAVTKEILEKETGPIQDIAAKPALSAEERQKQFDALVDRKRFMPDAQKE